jgi:hypothetical protein
MDSSYQQCRIVGWHDEALPREAHMVRPVTIGTALCLAAFASLLGACGGNDSKSNGTVAGGSGQGGGDRVGSAGQQNGGQQSGGRRGSAGQQNEGQGGGGRSGSAGQRNGGEGGGDRVGSAGQQNGGQQSGGHRGSAGAGGVVTDPPIEGCSNVTSGWSEWPVGDDTTLYYVSSSQGSDDNDGLSEDDPFASIPAAAEAVRAAAGAGRGEAAVVDAHLLVRRGDVFDAGFGNFTIHGMSAGHRFVVRPYGDESEPRPVITAELFRTQGGGGVPNEMVTAHVAFVGLHVYASWRDPDSDDYEGPDGGAAFTMLRPYDDIWMEDMMFESWTNLVIQPDPSGAHFVMRRSIVIDNYQRDADGHSQGVYASGADGILFEENVFDHNGWNPDVAGGEATMFNHNFYIQSDCRDPVLRGNIIARGSSHGFQLRPHGLAEGNLLIANAIAGFVAGDSPYDGMTQALRGNVMVHAGQHQFIDGSDRGWGLSMMLIDPDLAASHEAIDNIAAHSGPISAAAFDFDDGVETSGNIVYDWDGQSDAGPFVDPDRDIPSYHASIGGDRSIEAFLDGARMQRKGHWCEEYTAAAVNAYIREGFEVP